MGVVHTGRRETQSRGCGSKETGIWEESEKEKQSYLESEEQDAGIEESESLAGDTEAAKDLQEWLGWDWVQLETEGTQGV